MIGWAHRLPAIDVHDGSVLIRPVRLITTHHQTSLTKTRLAWHGTQGHLDDGCFPTHHGDSRTLKS